MDMGVGNQRRSCNGEGGPVEKREGLCAVDFFCHVREKEGERRGRREYSFLYLFLNEERKIWQPIMGRQITYPLKH